MPEYSRPILYIGEDTKSQQALELLQEAGFDVEVRVTPRYSWQSVAYGLPVLFGLSGNFSGVEGVRIFIENATLLGCYK